MKMLQGEEEQWHKICVLNVVEYRHQCLGNLENIIVCRLADDTGELFCRFCEEERDGRCGVGHRWGGRLLCWRRGGGRLLFGNEGVGSCRVGNEGVGPRCAGDKVEVFVEAWALANPLSL